MERDYEFAARMSFEVRLPQDSPALPRRVLFLSDSIPIASYPPLAYHCRNYLKAIGVKFLIQPITPPQRWIRMGD